MHRSAILNTKARSVRPLEVSSVRKALLILGSFSKSHACWSVSELARALQMPKSTTHNLLRTLDRFGFVKQSAADKRYYLGPKVYELGVLFAQSDEIIVRAPAYLRELVEQTGETAKLGLLSGGRVVVAAAVESSYQLHTRGDVGSSWPLHSTSLGKAILSILSPVEVNAIVKRHGLPRVTARSITSLSALQQAIHEIQERGYAVDNSENEEGVYCIAVPLPAPAGGAPASLSISGPSARLTPKKLQGWLPLLSHTAQQVALPATLSTTHTAAQPASHR